MLYTFTCTSDVKILYETYVYKINDLIIESINSLSQLYYKMSINSACDIQYYVRLHMYV